MSRMFGDRINEFVLSVDIMDKENFVDLITIVATYLTRQLGVVYFAVLEEGVVDGGPGMTTLWASNDNKPGFSVDKDGGYSSLSAYSFGENHRLWVVSKSRQPLGTADDYVDLWSGNADLPTYRPSLDEDIRTSVMHPLRREGRPIGVIEFGCENYIEPTPASLEEVGTLAATISRAFRLYDIREAQRENTKGALGLLKAALDTETWTKLALPQMFIAFPGGSDLEGPARTDHEKVVGTIREVVKEFSAGVHAEFWDDIEKSGNITSQIIDFITSSEFGCCYFSEPGAKAGEFVDNPNVLFEAGMMQALMNSPGALLRAWVAIRERKAGELPFDIASERILMVDRLDDGSLDVEAFGASLRARIGALLEDLKSGED